MNLALNNLQRLICHKTQTTNQLIIQKTFKKLFHILLLHFVAKTYWVHPIPPYDPQSNEIAERMVPTGKMGLKA